MIMPDIQPYVSPITGEVITSRPKQQAHMAQYGVTNMLDYSPEWREKAAKERNERLHGLTRADQQDRIEQLKHALEVHHER